MQPQDPPPYSGSLLVAHPGLHDPNFRKTIILISAHDEEDGSLGVIINRPTGQTLGELNDDYTFGPLAHVPVYEGGPVQKDQVLLVAWHWIPESAAFRVYFGVSEDKVQSLMAEQPGIEVRAFLGYSGWSEGQLETERKQNAWLVVPISGHLMEGLDGPAMWREILASTSPELIFLADAPDDPTRN
ncbi:YqgE/AlgH family protein [Ruficoccus sp. ZRK36]|uniref:YqgE/AlgH family protein n=1 Tax=Ruficoccus sp. ZRK36 TaxID=2866311 RepID=UPI001C730FF3|nr:YqgE/AlgH family protein [Ruficoccus sp. ZRK36]QYY34757.1 YqgE/AlgH family protein [Ruficoccus sp. ZRK36]